MFNVTFIDFHLLNAKTFQRTTTTVVAKEIRSKGRFVVLYNHEVRKEFVQYADIESDDVEEYMQYTLTSEN